jgi:hypothetical protein
VEPINWPVDGRCLAQKRLRICPRGDVDVAALCVRDHQQPAGSGALGDLAQSRPAGSAESLEARDLELDRDAVGRRCLDRQRAMGGDSACRPVRRRPVSWSLVGELDRPRPQPGGIWIQAQHQL